MKPLDNTPNNKPIELEPTREIDQVKSIKLEGVGVVGDVGGRSRSNQSIFFGVGNDQTKIGESIDLGRAAELLVASDLEFQGYTVSFAPQMCSYDLLVDVGGRILRVQAKATKSPYTWDNKKSDKYRFRLQKGGGNIIKGQVKRKNYDPSEVDIFALVAADIKTIAYVPVIGHITNCLEFYQSPDNMRRSTSKVITDFPFNKALSQLIDFKLSYQPPTICGDECSTQNQATSHLSGERIVGNIPT